MTKQLETGEKVAAKRTVAREKVVKKTNVVSGMLPSPDPMAAVVTLDDILGTRSSASPWKVKNLEDLETQMAEMNLVDLQRLATRVGLLPVSDRRVLKGRLSREYRVQARKNTQIDMSNWVDPDDSIQNASEEQTKRVRRILREGS